MRQLLLAILLIGLALTGLPACGESAHGEPDRAGASAPGPAASGDPAAFEELRNAAFRMFDAGAELGSLRDALLEAHALKPDAYGVNWRLGQVYADLRLHEEALERYLAAWEVRQDDPQILLRIVTLQTRLGHDEQALALMPGLHADEQLVGQALALEATLRDHMGDRAAALALVEQARELEPAIGYRAQSLHGRFLMQAGEMAAAHERFTTALSGRADYKEAVKGLADTCHRLGRANEAQHWETLLALLLDLTDNAYARKDSAQQRATLQQIVDLHPAWAGGFQQLAELQRRAGDMDAACQTIEGLIAHHDEGLDPLEVTRLRLRFCPEESP